MTAMGKKERGLRGRRATGAMGDDNKIHIGERKSEGGNIVWVRGWSEEENDVITPERGQAEILPSVDV